MNKTTCLSLLAGSAVVLGPTGVATANSDAYTNADEVRSIVAEMLADSESRSSLLQSGGNAGHDGKFFLASPDGDFRLNVGGQVQFRYLLNFRDDDAPDRGIGGAAEDDFESGFETRRTKLEFTGTVYDNIDFKVQGNFNTSTGTFTLQDVYADYNFDDNWSLRWGQFKAPFLREELVSSKRQLAADRSLVNEVFNQDRSQGIQLTYAGEDFRIMAAFTDGFNSGNTTFITPRGAGFTAPGTFDPNVQLSGGESDFALTLRGEIKFAGNWKQFRDFTSMPGSEYGVLLGFAGHIQYNDESELVPSAPGIPVGDADGDGDATDLFSFNDDAIYYAWTIDLSIEGDGWNFYIAGTGGHNDWDDVVLTDGTPSTTDVDTNDFGIVVQGGFFIPDTDWELFARYDVLIPDGDRQLDDSFNTITLGTNYYLHGHAAKFTFDVQYFIDDENSLAGPQGPIGYLQDVNDEGEVALRFQFQLLF